MQPSEYPIEAFIHYLTTYGPGGTTNVSLYDERVVSVAKRSGIEPITLVSDDVNQLIALLQKDAPCNILVTGVAGDGKTYLCRQAWKALNGSEAEWDSKNIVSTSTCTEGRLMRKVVIVKDLTDNDYNKDIDNPNNILNLLNNDLSNPNSTIIIACNHGQILKKLRDTQRPELIQLANILERRFFDTSVRLPDGLFLFDLKQSRQDNMFKKIVKVICTREEWQGCEHCAKCDVCPILKNRNALYHPLNGFSQITERMALLFRLLELEGLHFPIREQLSFVANAILGKSHITNVPDDLAECKDVCADPKHLTDRVDLYDNLFGWNLTRYKQLNTNIYSSLRRFEIGKSTTRFLDSLLIDGIPQSLLKDPDAPKLDLSDHFVESRQHFLADQPSDATIEHFQDELKRARRRLFFTWTPEDTLKVSVANSNDYSIWSLTSLPHAKNYLAEFIDDFDDRPNKNKENKVDTKLFTGLFRVMTGCRVLQFPIELLITTRGAEVSSKAGQLQIARFPNRKSSLFIRSESETSALPVLHIVSNSDKDVTFKLTPRRFECLMQLSEGYTASSFSRECLSELMGLKAKLIHDYRTSDPDEGYDDDSVTITLFPGREIEIQLD